MGINSKKISTDEPLATVDKGKSVDGTFLGRSTLRRMLDAAYNEKNPLHSRWIFSECMIANCGVIANPSIGDEIVYLY